MNASATAAWVRVSVGQCSAAEREHHVKRNIELTLSTRPSCHFFLWTARVTWICLLPFRGLTLLSSHWLALLSSTFKEPPAPPAVAAAVVVVVVVVVVLVVGMRRQQQDSPLALTSLLLPHPSLASSTPALTCTSPPSLASLSSLSIACSSRRPSIHSSPICHPLQPPSVCTDSTNWMAMRISPHTRTTRG